MLASQLLQRVLKVSREVSDDVALVTYRTIGQEGRETRRSSIWLLRTSGWQIVFHQGTRVQNRFHDR